MKVNENFVIREIAGEYIIIPAGEMALKFSGFISTNEVGVFIWKQLLNDSTKESILEAILNEFEIEKEEAERDLEDFLMQLHRLELLNR